MVKIEAIIKPYTLERVRNALAGAGVTGMTVYEVKGTGPINGRHQVYRGAEYTESFFPNVKLETVVADDQADKVVDVLAKAAKTGKPGDGKIFSYAIGQAVRIGNGQTGAQAL